MGLWGFWPKEDPDTSKDNKDQQNNKNKKNRGGSRERDKSNKDIIKCIAAYLSLSQFVCPLPLQGVHQSRNLADVLVLVLVFVLFFLLAGILFWCGLLSRGYNLWKVEWQAMGHGLWHGLWHGAAVKDDINIIAISFIFAALDAV